MKLYCVLFVNIFNFINFIRCRDLQSSLVDNIDKIVEQNRKCIEDTKKSSALVKKRFSDNDLAILCKNRLKWSSRAEAQKLSDVSSSDQELTQKQLDWLNGVYSCTDLSACVCANGRCNANESSNGNSLRRNRRQLPERVLRPALRKEYRMLSDFERSKFHSAMNQLKSDKIDNLSKYDLLSIYHTPEHSPGAHWGPAFLPFHRELLKQLEAALRSYDQSVALPYWDSTLDEGLPDPRHSILWTDSFLGNGDGYVESGPFKFWNTTQKVLDEQRLARGVGRAPFGSLFRPDDIQSIIGKTKYNDLTACVDPFFELLHGTVHMWVGGFMLDIPISPNDPSFYLHHTFVDYVWEKFRLEKQDRIHRQLDYPTENQSCSSYHYMGNFMLPFKLRNIDGLANSYTDNYYVYESRPTCSNGRTSCHSPYLFCHLEKHRCLSKVVPGGNCTGFEKTDICHQSVCQDGVCKPLDQKVRLNPTDATPEVTEKSPLKKLTTSLTSTIPVETTIQLTTEISSAKPFDRVDNESTTTATVSTEKSFCSCSCDCPSTESFSFTMNENRSFTESNVEQGNSVLNLAKFQKDFVSNETDNNEDNYVWFTVTVLAGNANSFIKRYANATVKVTGLNYDDLFVTEVSTRTGYPFYPGATLIKAKNPIALNGHTRIKIEASYQSKKCTPFCYQNTAINYAECSGELDLRSSDNVSEQQHSPVEIYSNETHALLKPWNERSRKSDYLMFLCEQENLKKSSNICQFVRLDNFVLVGYSDKVIDGKSLEECKSVCKNNQDDKTLKCNSLMYWKKRQTCVITKESRFSQPALFGHFPNESAIYMDYVCDTNRILEN